MSEWTVTEEREGAWRPKVWRHPGGREIVMLGANHYRTGDAWGELGRSESFQEATTLRRAPVGEAELLKLADRLALDVAASSAYEPQTVEAALQYIIGRRVEVPKPGLH